MQVTKGEGEPGNKTAAQSTENAAEQATGTVDVSSTPAGADVLVDGQFVGNCPATLKLQQGKHAIIVKMSGFKDWSRQITVEPGSQVQLNAILEKID